MSAFTTLERTEYGRRGVIDTSAGRIQTPALLPVANLIAGTTPQSGGIWRYTRRHLFQSDSVQGIMFQTMTFLDYNLTPAALDRWREQPLRDHFRQSEEPDFTQPVFVDSGGFKLMNSTTFGQPPEEGGSKNDWGIYTNPESILELQLDYGADIIATLDLPIPPNLKRAEAEQRMEQSIDNAVECLQLLEGRGEGTDQSVYVAIHGHNYEDINWYVSKFLERSEALDHSVTGFALGSLVPVSNQAKTLVDSVIAAKDAIPEAQQDDIALHVFGISGRLCPLLALLGVDSFDSANYLKAARNKSFIHPETWQRRPLDTINWDDWPCTCQACRSIDIGDMRHALLESDVAYERIQGENGKRFKSEFYADIARHNLELYSRQMQDVRNAIDDGRLLDEVASFAVGKDIVEEGLKRIQLHRPELRDRLAAIGYGSLVAGPATTTFQSKLTGFLGGEDHSTQQRTISLEHGPSDFDILQYEYQPPTEASILLILPCSQEKPYSESRTQQAVLSQLEEHRDEFHKISVSGLYGPVPVSYETLQPVLEYEYVLTTSDTDQMALVANRLAQYLNTHGDHFSHILAYTTNKAYREAIMEAFRRYGRGEVYPSDPRALQLTEHFRNANIAELVDKIETITAKR